MLQVFGQTMESITRRSLHRLQRMLSFSVSAGGFIRTGGKRALLAHVSQNAASNNLP
jgi:hypothetical protein